MRMSKTNFRAGLLGAAAVAVLGFASTGPAHAGALAIAILDVQSLNLVDSGGNQITSGLTLSNVNVSALVSNSINGAQQNQDSGNFAVTGNGVLTEDTFTACFGDCAPNPVPDFGPVNDPFDTSRTYAAGLLTAGGSFLTSTGLKIQTRSQSSVAGSDDVWANQSSFPNFSYEAVISTGGSSLTDLQFNLEGVDQLVTMIEGSPPAAAEAEAHNTWQLSIRSLGVGGAFLPGFSPWAPGDAMCGPANLSISANSDAQSAFIGDPDDCAFPGTAMSPTFDLISGTDYLLTLSHISSTGVEFIPEPMSLALLGSGLLGLGVLRRRQSKKA